MLCLLFLVVDGLPIKTCFYALCLHMLESSPGALHTVCLNPVQVLMEKAWQMTKHGIRKTERYLPVGTVVTCVGELSHNTIASPHPASSSSPSPPSPSSGSLSLESGSSSPASSSSSSSSGPSSPVGLFGGPIHLGSTLYKAVGRLGDANSPPFVLRKPVSGPSYITPLTIEQLRASLSGAARNYRMLAFGLGAVGVFLVARKAVGRVMQALHERRVRHRVAAVEAARKARKRAAAAAAARGGASCGGAAQSGAGTGSGQQSGQQEQGLGAGGESDADDRDREPDTCVICLESTAGMCLLRYATWRYIYMVSG